MGLSAASAVNEAGGGGGGGGGAGVVSFLFRGALIFVSLLVGEDGSCFAPTAGAPFLGCRYASVECGNGHGYGR